MIYEFAPDLFLFFFLPFGAKTFQWNLCGNPFEPFCIDFRFDVIANDQADPLWWGKIGYGELVQFL